MAITKLDEGGYQVEVYLGRHTVNGKTKRLTKTKSFRLKLDAEKWQRDQLDARDRGEISPRKPDTRTLSDWLDTWLDGPAKLNASTRTQASYRRLLANYIRPALGEVQLIGLTTEMVDEVLTKLYTEGKSSRTVRYTASVLRAALNVAVSRKLLPSNPVVGVKLPKKKGATRRIKVPKVATLSKADALKFLKSTEEGAYGPLWNVLIYTGLRPGEALALRWEDIDLDAGTLHVRRALRPAEKGVPAELADPKTSKSRRTVPLLSKTVKALKKRKADRPDGASESDLVFASPSGVPLKQDLLYRYHFLPALEAAGVPAVTMYACRHTFATLALEAGVPMKVVSDQLGHSTITLTADTYSHVSPALQAQSVVQMQRYLRG